MYVTTSSTHMHHFDVLSQQEDKMKVVLLAIFAVSVHLAAAQQCPPGVPTANCLVDPCTTASCPTISMATCRADYCGGCNARWYIGSIEVTRNCTNPCAAVSCLAPNCPNPYTPAGECCPRCPNNTQASCPVPEPGSIGSCVFACADNSSCPGSQLCCSNGCGRVCVDPVYTNVTVTCAGPNGRTYRPGETYTAADGCNTCTCTSSGLSACTEIACPQSCVDENGNRYSVGQSFPAADGCNNCTCTSSGAIACTRRACPDICSLPAQVGLCNALFYRYHYNTRTRICERFVYGGCGGNQNNFETAGDCYRRCNPSSQCIQPTYPTDFDILCLVVQRKWAFNANTSRCEAISYSPCGQEREGYNVFDTESECNRTCVRAQATQPGTCPPGVPIVLCFVDPCTVSSCPGVPTARCEANYCGGCNAFYYDATGNNVTDRCAATTNVTCTGPDGRRYRPGETYTADDGCNTCTCGSSGLSTCTRRPCPLTCVDSAGRHYSIGQTFPSADGCNNCTCTSSGVIACTERACVDICSLPRESGVCLAYIPSYFYNRNSMRCERFIYGGCGGNQNRFTTEAECYQRCNPTAALPSPTLTSVCPRVSGGTSGLCVQACSSDNDCSGDQMCCSNGCGRSCVDPDRIPYYDIPRQCPTSDDSDLTTGTCVLTNASCLTNEQCDTDGELCCQSGCGRRCTRSVIPSQPCTAVANQFRVVNHTLSGHYTPQCNSTNGTFQPFQCHPSTGYCWCVNVRTGQPVSGFYPRGIQPNCTTCNYNNRIYHTGESFPSSDGCNTCQCSSTGNVFCTLRACIDTCSLPPETGPCRASIPAFYYDRSRGACLPFIYGGCGGNDNKFHTIADCLGRCDPNNRCLRSAPICVDTFNSSVDTGNYKFNATSGRCERFPSGCTDLPFFPNLMQCQQCNPGNVPDPCATVRCARPNCTEDRWITDPGACCARCRPPTAVECDDDEFRCSDTRCISREWVCDGLRDCDDGRDETERQCPRNGTCSGHSCGDGVCIPSDYVCDNYLDCRDASDEANCTSATFQNTFYPRQLPSRCPDSRSLIGSCVEECSSDSPCVNNLLCCSNGCGRSCMAGMTVAPLCPALRGQSGGIGAFIPQCEDDGSFLSVQCWGSTGYCWCVESTSGRPVTEGVRGQPECPGCSVNGITYQYGERFTAEDGCNTCFCSSSGVAACTREACAPVSCMALDKEIPHGQTLDEDCFTCMCLSGQLNCTRKKCATTGAVTQKPPIRVVMGFDGDLNQLTPTDDHKENLKREVMKTLLNRYKDRLGLTQDQLSEIELTQDGGISIGVTITESENTSVGADVTILVGQMQQDYQSNALVIRYNRAVLEPSGDFQVDDGSDDSDSPAGFPTWGIVIIVVGALVLVAALSVVIMAVMITLKGKSQRPYASADSNDYTKVSFQKNDDDQELKLPLD